MDLLEPARKNLLASLANWLIDGYWPAVDSVRTVQSPERLYTVERLLADGDAAAVYLAHVAPEMRYLLKVARDSEGRKRLHNERATLAKLGAVAGDTTYRCYLSELTESFTTATRPSKRVNVFHYEPEFRTLEEVHEQYPALEVRNLAWIFNRLLTILGFCHRQRVLHGAILPCHVLIDAASHGLRLVGWGASVLNGQWLRTVSPRYRDWYPPEVLHQPSAGPATDLFLAARCLVYLAGGDPVTDWMPATVPPPMQRFLATCLLPTPRMRPDDAWALQEEFAALLRPLYGPPKFHELILT